jgi:hypothetical protein
VFVHPDAFNEVYEYAPLTVYVTPFKAHMYVSHEEAVIEDDEL